MALNPITEAPVTSGGTNTVAQYSLMMIEILEMCKDQLPTAAPAGGGGGRGGRGGAAAQDAAERVPEAAQPQAVVVFHQPVRLEPTRFLSLRK